MTQERESTEASGRTEDLDEEAQQGYAAWMRKVEDDLAPPITPEPLPRLSSDQPEARSVTDDEKLWSVLSHVSLFVLLIIGPLIVMLTAGKRYSYVRHHAAEALNFQITVTLVAMVLSTLLSVIGVLQFELAWLITLIIVALLLALFVGFFAFPIRAAVRSYQGQLYRYPLTIRFVRPGRRHVNPGYVEERAEPL